MDIFRNIFRVIVGGGVFIYKKSVLFKIGLFVISMVIMKIKMRVEFFYIFLLYNVIEKGVCSYMRIVLLLNR